MEYFRIKSHNNSQLNAFVHGVIVKKLRDTDDCNVIVVEFVDIGTSKAKDLTFDVIGFKTTVRVKDLEEVRTNPFLDRNKFKLKNYGTF